MIRLPPPSAPLTNSERYALTVLVDLSRLVPVRDPAADVVDISVTDAPSAGSDVHGNRSAPFPFHGATVDVSRQTLRWITDAAGAAAEQRSSERDRYSRVPSQVNPLVMAGTERQPAVSQLAAAFRAAVLSAAGRRPVRLVAPWPLGRRWAVALTHDVDVVAWWPVFTALRTIELSRKGQRRTAVRSVASAVMAIGRDPITRGIRDILDVEREFGVRSTWFFLCGTPTWDTMRAGDLTYVPESSAMRRIVNMVATAGHEVGLHGSFATLASSSAFVEQRDRLQQLTSRAVHGVRQHYLRMHPGTTQRAMAESGFLYDATYGFPDRSGFRLGVSDVVPGWDEQRQDRSALDEVPLTWMDRTLSKYQGLEDPNGWVRDALDVAEAARASEGLWVGLWHPNLIPPLGYPGAPTAYRALLAALTADAPYVDSMVNIVRWRVARRGLYIHRVISENRVDARLSCNADHPIALEDATGRIIEEGASVR